MLRKYVYGGIPPTDPRFLSMTMEQVEVDLSHWELDNKLRDGTSEEYKDPEFEDYDKETDELDDKSSYEYMPDAPVRTSSHDWEDVEDEPDFE